VLNDDDAFERSSQEYVFLHPTFVDDSVLNRGIAFAIKSLMRFADYSCWPCRAMQARY